MERAKELAEAHWAYIQELLRTHMEDAHIINIVWEGGCDK